MNRKLVKDLMLLLNHGWRPYNHKFPDSLYARLCCFQVGVKGKGKEPVWFVRGEVFLCVSCNRSCSLTRPEGVLLPLPLPVSRQARDRGYSLTPGEMVAAKALLRVDEVAYCLNIAERSVYDWVAEGKLPRAWDGEPLRIPSEAVSRYMQNFEV
jgi:excisionase family DNA binding protein